MNLHSTTMKVVRKGEEVTVDVQAEVSGDIVAINKVSLDGNPFVLDDNETGAARCFIMHALYPKQDYDKRGLKLLGIARQYPGL